MYKHHINVAAIEGEATSSTVGNTSDFILVFFLVYCK